MIQRLEKLTGSSVLTLASQVHFHIVPAALRPSTEEKAKKPAASTNPMALMGLGHGREELDDEEAEKLCKKIRNAAEELRKEPNAKL